MGILTNIYVMSIQVAYMVLFYYSNRITINERCFENLENLYHFVSLLTDEFSSCLQQLSFQNDAFFFQFSTCNKSLASYFQISLFLLCVCHCALIFCNNFVFRCKLAC